MKQKSKLGFWLVASLLFYSLRNQSSNGRFIGGFLGTASIFQDTIRFLSLRKQGIGDYSLDYPTVLRRSSNSRRLLRALQEVQPHIKQPQEKYPGKDMESRTALAEETQKLYKEKGVNPMPHSFRFYSDAMPWLCFALTRVDFMKTGHFSGSI